MREQEDQEVCGQAEVFYFKDSEWGVPLNDEVQNVAMGYDG